jgi:hypothetical protein
VHGEHPADEAAASPVRKRHLSAAAGDPRQLGNHAFGLRREHDAEHREHHVEAGAGVREILHRSLVEGNR